MPKANSTVFYINFMLIFFGQILDSKAQVLYDTGQIANEITTIINAMPSDTSGNDYIPPTALQLNTFTQTLNLIHSGNYADAADSAATLNYSLTHYYDTGEVVDEALIMLQNSATNYWGTYIFNPNYCKPLVIQSPHPKFDFNTGKQGIYVYRKTDAYAFMMSGTHRCNSSVYTTCSGSTDVCAVASEDYRISDMAHFDSSLFHFATKNLYDQFSNTVFIQLHGFTKGGSDPYVIMSNGTRNTPLIDYLDTLDGALYAEDNVLTFKLVHIDSTWTKLTGLTNVQGRYINQSGNPCITSATTSTGRFLHLEQEKDRLRANSTGWAKMANALNNVFTCTALPVQLLSFYGKRQNDQILIQWATASELNNEKFELQRLENQGRWRSMYTAEGGGNSNQKRHYSFIDSRPPVGDAYYRLIQTDFDGKSQISGNMMVSGETMRHFDFFPNPASKSLQMTMADLSAAEIRIFSMDGKLWLSHILQPTENTLDISALPPGIYQIHCVQGLQFYVKKLVVNPRLD